MRWGCSTFNLLSSYRVLDLAGEMGMFCGKVLGDFGADVIKIEPPSGSPARRIGPFYHDEPDREKSLYWFAYNTNKRGITLDIETTDGQVLLKRLAEKADFLVESFPPGYLEGLGLGYRALSAVNPRMIVCSITPFGQSGPCRDYKSSDLVAMATGGMLYICGDPDRPPVRTNADLAYCQAGIQAATAMMIAHHNRRVTGEGQYIDVSLQESITSILWHTQHFWDLARVVVKRTGKYMKREPVEALSIWPCKDGSISWQMTAAFTGDWTAKLVEWMNEEGMASRELAEIKWQQLDRDAVAEDKMNEWNNEFAAFFMTKTKAELMAESTKRNFMLFPCFNMEDCLDDEQLRARNFWSTLDHPELGQTITYPGDPLILKGVDKTTGRRAPLIGEHNQEIYMGELGLSREQMVMLREANVI